MLAALAARAASPSRFVAGPWATLTVTGEGFNPTQETWQFGLSDGGALYISRTSGSRIYAGGSTSLTSSSECPALLGIMAQIPGLSRARPSPIPPPNGLRYRLDVISARAFSGVRGPLHLTGEDFSPLAAWTRRLALTIDRCSGRHRRRALRRPGGRSR